MKPLRTNALGAKTIKETNIQIKFALEIMKHYCVCTDVYFSY